MLRIHLAALAAACGLVFGGAASAQVQCFGSGEYRVCSESRVDAAGNLQIRSWDSQGNTYSVGSESHRAPDGTTTIRSRDSMGNSYQVRSWSDRSGTHSVDSLGNRCTITRTGQMIGCK